LLEIENRAAVRDAKESAGAVSDLKAELAIIEAELQAIPDDAGRDKEAALELERIKVLVGSALEHKETYQDPIRQRTDTTTQLAELRQLMAIDVLSSFDHMVSLSRPSLPDQLPPPRVISSLFQFFAQVPSSYCLKSANR
jgi:hypothetical protein